MIRNYLLILLLCMSGLAALAESVVSKGALTWEAIDSERAQAKALFDRQEFECQKRFVVTDCVREVDVRRREHSARLRQHEDILKDQERQKRALDATRAREQREAERKQRDTEQRLVSPRTPRHDSINYSTLPASPERPSVSGDVVPSHKPSLEQMSRNRAAFEAKQKAVEERRAAVANRLRQSSGASAPKALPIPP